MIEAVRQKNQDKVLAEQLAAAQLAANPPVMLPADDGSGNGTVVEDGVTYDVCCGRKLKRAVQTRVLKDYDDAPPQHPAMGDKTPAFVDWIYRRHPKDAKLRYAGRNVLPSWEKKDEEGGEQ